MVSLIVDSSGQENAYKTGGLFFLLRNAYKTLLFFLLFSKINKKILIEPLVFLVFESPMSLRHSC